MNSPWFDRIVPPLILAGIASTILYGTLGASDRFVGDPLGELPVKVWVLETFARVGIFGGQLDVVGFPNVGPLNNPDPVGTVFTAALRPMVGRVWAYNLLVYTQVYASMLAAWALCRTLVGNSFAAMAGGVVFGFAPLVLAYAVSGAVTDILNLWPYPLAMLAVVRAFQAPTPRGNATWAAVSGSLAGVGFVSCPYNFVVFASMLFPFAIALPAAWRQGLIPVGPELRPGLRRVGVVAALVVVALAVVAGTHVLQIRGLMTDPNSQMSESAVSATRHTWPYRFLEAGHRDRYVATLSDYLAMGKGALIERVAAAQFYRAFSPGLVVLGLCAVGLAKARRRGTLALWLAAASFCILASTGPFLPLSSEVSFILPINVPWLLTQFALPGGNLILEPFRYALAAALALGVLASYGTLVIAQLLGRWTSLLIPMLIAAEVAWVSPAPMPIETARLSAPAIYRHLDQWLGPGAIIELPYFDHASDRFYREQFFHQLVHGRAIANEVMGFAPRYLRDNQFTALLLSIEKSSGLLKVAVTDPTRIEADRSALRADGFAGIILDPGGYATDSALAAVQKELAWLGAPVRAPDRLIYVLVPPAPPP